MYIVDPTLETDTGTPPEMRPDGEHHKPAFILATVDTDPLTVMAAATQPDPLVHPTELLKSSAADDLSEVKSSAICDGDDAASVDLADLDLQESFSRFRSRSEGSGLGRPRKGLLKKNSDPDTLKLRRRVSFADSNGFQLEQVRSFDAQPTGGALEVDDDDNEDCLLPSPAAVAAVASSLTNGSPRGPRPSGERRFVPYFSLPWNTATGGKHCLVFGALEDRKVCLEAFTIHSSWRISGTILVKNLSFHKRVFVRRTLDKWRSYRDVEATHVCSVNENVDRFHFELHFAFKLPAGTRLEVAMGYETMGGAQGRQGQYWDNNCENNYAFWFNDKS